MMFHIVKEISALSNMRLAVQFTNGTTKLYDVKPLEKNFQSLNNSKINPYSTA